jgi:hypothetical protein
MPDPEHLERYARRVARERDAARSRSLSRRLGGSLFRKYLEVVPSVFTGQGEFGAYRLLLPRKEALELLREKALFTLDTATELLAGFRFGRARNDYAYFSARTDLEWMEEARLAERRPGTSFPLAWTPSGWEMLFAVIPRNMPPNLEIAGFRFVSREHLIRDLIGLYGTRLDLLAAIEAKLKG